MTSIIKPSRRTFLKTGAAATAAAVVGAPWVAKASSKVVLRIATLAPKGSSWDNAFRASAREIKAATNGEVEIKVYAGAVMGDEQQMVRKMRTGQLDGAAITSVGLGEIDPQLLMLQLPLLFKNDKQLDYVRNAMMPTFEKRLADAGFMMGAPGDVGPLYVFSNTPVKVPSDIKATKMWRWDTDPITKKTMEIIGANAVPLGVPDVLPSLQTGLINAFTNSPYGAIALMWYTEVKHVTNLRLAMGIGASVLTLKAWNSLSSDAQAMLKRVTEESHGKLLKRIRKDNDAAVKALVSKGLKVVEPEKFSEWNDVAVRVRKELTGTLFDKALVDEMMGHLAKVQ